jgi:hypothetical protein
VTICEDVWNDKSFWTKQRYLQDPVEKLLAQEVDVIINLSASPFSVGKQAVREAMIGNIARRSGVPIIYVNQVGGNDDLIFDGRSVAFDGQGTLRARGTPFAEDILVLDPERDGPGSLVAEDDPTPESEVFHGLVLGTRDYLRKCGFRQALLGLSGGVDSSLTAVVAAEAIGPDNVLGVLMPSTPWPWPGTSASGP